MRRILLELSYLGTAYHGWQVQTSNISIQSLLQEKISLLMQSPTDVTGCGRTDAGVHARQYFAHFDTNSGLNIDLKKSLNAMLPADIAIINVYHVPSDFHARYDAIRRKYIYQLYMNKDPFHVVDSYFFRECNSIDIDKLQEAANVIGKLDDFSSFVKSGNSLTNFKCNIFESQWIQISNQQFQYHIAANRFVRGMVRLITGMCINYALEKISMNQLLEDLNKGKQISKSWSMPAIGLSLVEIKYPEDKMQLWELFNTGV